MGVFPGGVGASVPAGTLTLTGQPAADQTVTVGSKIYLFQTTLTDVDGNVLIGASASDTIDNLIAALNLGVGAGSVYATSMSANTDVALAEVGAGDTMGLYTSNEVPTTDTTDNTSWDVATSVPAGILTLTGNPTADQTITIGSKVYLFQTILTDVDGNVLIGAAATDTIDNLIAAINLGAGAGSTYATSMTANTDVAQAAVGAGDTMELYTNSAVPTTDTRIFFARLFSVGYFAFFVGIWWISKNECRIKRV